MLSWSTPVLACSGSGSGWSGESPDLGLDQASQIAGLGGREGQVEGRLAGPSGRGCLGEKGLGDVPRSLLTPSNQEDGTKHYAGIPKTEGDLSCGEERACIEESIEKGFVLQGPELGILQRRYRGVWGDFIFNLFCWTR